MRCAIAAINVVVLPLPAWPRTNNLEPLGFIIFNCSEVNLSFGIAELVCVALTRFNSILLFALATA